MAYGSDKFRRKVRCIETGIIYSCAAEAAKAYQVGKGSIQKNCIGISKSCRGLHFEYASERYMKKEEPEKQKGLDVSIPYCNLKEWISVDGMMLLNDPNDLSHTVDITHEVDRYVVRETKVINGDIVTKTIGKYLTSAEAKQHGRDILHLY